MEREREIERDERERERREREERERGDPPTRERREIEGQIRMNECEVRKSRCTNRGRDEKERAKNEGEGKYKIVTAPFVQNVCTTVQRTTSEEGVTRHDLLRFTHVYIAYICIDPWRLLLIGGVLG